MSARQEIRRQAELFRWSCHTDGNEDTFIHGQNMVAVWYRRDDTVDCGKRYEFFRITELNLQEITANRNKKSAVISWLVQFGT